MKIPRSYIIWLVTGGILIILFGLIKPAEINWQKSYSCRDDIPFGTSAIYHQIDDLFPGKDITITNQTYKQYLEQDKGDFSIITIDQSVYYDNPSMKKLLEHIASGNELFISAYNIDHALLDTLGIEKTNNIYGFNKGGLLLKTQGTTAQLDTISQVLKIYNYQKFVIADSNKSKVQVLGTIFGNPNFVSIAFGKGKIFLHLEPMAFSNYYFLRGHSYDYAEAALQLLQTNHIIWDDYPNNGLKKQAHLFRVIWTKPALKTAYYILLAWLFLFLLLAGRRKQRKIPVIPAIKNSSIEFIQTITNLYMGTKNHQSIAVQLIQNFHYTLSKEFHVPPQHSVAKKITLLSDKTNHPEAEIKELFDHIALIESSVDVDKQDLKKLYQLTKKITNR